MEEVKAEEGKAEEGKAEEGKAEEGKAELDFKSIATEVLAHCTNASRELDQLPMLGKGDLVSVRIRQSLEQIVQKMVLLRES